MMLITFVLTSWILEPICIDALKKEQGYVAVGLRFSDGVWLFHGQLGYFPAQWCMYDVL